MDTGTQSRLTNVSDVQVFFTAVLGLALVLLFRDLSFRLLGMAEYAPFGPPLISRTVAPESVRLQYLAFVLLPALVAFLAIGVPVLVRVLLGAFRGAVTLQEAFLLVLLPAGTGAAFAASGHDYVVLAILVLVIVVCALGAWPLVGRLSARFGYRLLLISGLCLGGLASYEYKVISGADPSVTVAPSLLVGALFLLPLALAMVTAASGEKGVGCAAMTWVLVSAIYAAPFVRRAAANAPAADSLEAGLTAVLAALLCILALAIELMRTRARS